MLSRLANMSGIALGPLRDWEVHFDNQEEQESISTAGTALVIDLRALRSLMPSLSERVLQNIATSCVSPACHGFRSVKDNLDLVVEILSDLELNREIDLEDDALDSLPKDMDVSIACPLNLVTSPSQNAVPSSSHHEDILGQNLSLKHDTPQKPDLCPPNFTIPTILVSPCAPSEHHMACRVPIQDSAFGDQLTVPSYPAFNRIFPPMILPQQPLLALLQSWTWQSGHWQATLPSIREQESRGLFSRALKRKRTRRTRMCQ